MIDTDTIKIIATALGYILDKVVFVGGAFVNFYSTDNAVTEVRPTEDIDCVVEVVHLSDYNEFEQKIRKLGFKNDFSESAPICRYIYKDIKVDFMPTSGSILGFQNKWYCDGFKNAKIFNIDEKISLKIFSPEYFIASKLDALFDRGINDFRLSKDFEDIIFIVNSRNELFKEITLSEETVKTFIIEKFKFILNSPDTNEGIIAVSPRDIGVDRINFIKNTIEKIANID